MVLSDDQLRNLAARMCDVPGVVGVVLGGSRGRGKHLPDSDTDLGLYYRPPLDVAALRSLARAVAGEGAQVTEPGEWGPWVDGGAWLRIAGAAVDWIYRDLDRVHAAWVDARSGRYRFHAQTGHPLGVPDFAYAGELALGVVLADPTVQLTRLQHATRQYPPALTDALVRGLWEATFILEVARKAVTRRDTVYVAGCLFRALGLCAHALHGHAGRWLVNEKGAIAAAARLPGVPADFAARAHGPLAQLGSSPEDLIAALDATAELVEDTVAACRAS